LEVLQNITMSATRNVVNEEALVVGHPFLLIRAAPGLGL